MVLRQRALLRSLIWRLPSTFMRRCLLRMARVVLRLRAASCGSLPPSSARRWQVLNLSRLFTSVRPTLLSLLSSFSIPLTLPPASRYSRRLSRIIRPIFFMAFEFFSLRAARPLPSLLRLATPSSTSLGASQCLLRASSEYGKVRGCSESESKRCSDIYSWESCRLGSVSSGCSYSIYDYWSQQGKIVGVGIPKSYWINSSQSLPLLWLINYYVLKYILYESLISINSEIPTPSEYYSVYDRSLAFQLTPTHICKALFDRIALSASIR